ncbi:MAG TPA: FtsQ-type POTRA domain-containing protein [Actinomycetota bacterium]|nr:FtsQ-type POTRA domain-containing protein [Actinomycetota bacterium]
MRAPEPAERPHRGWALAGLAAIVVAGAAVAATYTPLFAARDIQVRGAGDISRAGVLRLAGVEEGSNVFHLDARAVERRLEGDPRILGATVSTQLPDRVEIALVRRRPVAVVGSPGALVGADGVLIGPTIEATDLPSLVSGPGRPVGDDDLVTGARAADALGPSLRGAVDAIVVMEDGELALRLAAGFTATFGPATELEAKAGSLGALLTWIQQEDVAVVSADLTVPGSPTATLDRDPHAVPVP